ncbi:hypothetical protein [Streptomyces sp. NPDC048665]|uniref:hypothetical protein n=1 Tax=Streptomyces sp. NPDC048665 TaxID=3155490 RepID=UPI00341A4EF7
MDWGTLIATGLGATIGVGSTLLNESIRTRREREDRREAARHQLYSDYLAALARVADELWILGQAPNQSDIKARAHDVWRRGDAYPLRYHMTVTAPVDIAAASDACFRGLRDFRDVIAAGMEGGSADFMQAQSKYDELLTALRWAMRADLAG